MSELVGFISLGVLSGLTLLGWYFLETLQQLWRKLSGTVGTPSQARPVHALWGLIVLASSLGVLWLIEGVELVQFSLLACSSMLLILLLFCKLADGVEQLGRMLFRGNRVTNH